jgi:hypothetical protein
MLGIIVWHQENAGVELERLMQELKRMIERLTNFLHAGLVQTISVPNPFRGGRNQAEEAHVIARLFALRGELLLRASTHPNNLGAGEQAAERSEARREERIESEDLKVGDVFAEERDAKPEDDRKGDDADRRPAKRERSDQGNRDVVQRVEVAPDAAARLNEREHANEEDGAELER